MKVGDPFWEMTGLLSYALKKIIANRDNRGVSHESGNRNKPAIRRLEEKGERKENES
jgi:hypothetical protein